MCRSKINRLGYTFQGTGRRRGRAVIRERLSMVNIVSEVGSDQGKIVHIKYRTRRNFLSVLVDHKWKSAPEELAICS